MHVGIKRGLETALLTGGLLGLWTGMASADDSSIDVDVPVTVSGTSVAVLGDATAAGGRGSAGGSGGDGVVEVGAPVTVCGTGVGVVGDATAGCGTAGGGSGGTGGDGVVEVGAPVTVCGTGVGVSGNATAVCGTAAPATPAAPCPPATRTASDPTATPARYRASSHSEVAILPVAMDGGSVLRDVAGDSTDGELAYTGIGLELPVVIGLVALVTGLVLTLASRRPVDGAVR